MKKVVIAFFLTSLMLVSTCFPVFAKTFHSNKIHEKKVKLDKTNYTPLMFAARNGYLNLAKILANKSGSINAANIDGLTPLMFSIAFGHLNIAELLVAHGAKE